MLSTKYSLLFQAVLLIHSVYSEPDTLCTFSEDLIQEYDNAKGTTPIEAEFHVQVGIGKSSSGTIGGNHGFEVSNSSGSSSGGEVGFSFFGISASVKHEVTKSSSTSASISRSWELASEDTWNQQSSRITKYTIPPGTRVKLYQDVAQCGEYKVRNSRIRRDDEDATPIEELMRLKKLEQDDIALEMHKTSLELEYLRERQKLESNLTGRELELKHNITLSEILAKQENQKRLKDSFDKLEKSLLEIHERNQAFLNRPGDREHELKLKEQALKAEEQRHRHEEARKQADRDHEIKMKQLHVSLAGGPASIPNSDEEGEFIQRFGQSKDASKYYTTGTSGDITTISSIGLILIGTLVLALIVIIGLLVYICRRRSDSNTKVPPYSVTNSSVNWP